MKPLDRCGAEQAAIIRKENASEGQGREKRMEGQARPREAERAQPPEPEYRLYPEGSHRRGFKQVRFAS